MKKLILMIFIINNIFSNDNLLKKSDILNTDFVYIKNNELIENTLDTVVDELLKIKEISIDERIKNSEIFKTFIDKKYKLTLDINKNNEILKVIFEKNNEKYEWEYSNFAANELLKKITTTDGNTQIIEYYKNGKIKLIEKTNKNSKEFNYFYEDGTIKEAGNYILNKSNEWIKAGTWIEYFNDGKKFQSLLYEDSKIYLINFLDNEKNSKNFEGEKKIFNNELCQNGLWLYYDDDENIKYKADFKENTGKFYLFYDILHNQISSITSVVLISNNWEWNGEKIYYDLDGRILEKQIKEKDIIKLIGHYQNESNSIKYTGERTTTSDSTIKSGIWCYYTTEGKISELITYHENKGLIVEYYDFDKNQIKFEGNIIQKDTYYAWIGLQTYYDKDGNKETVTDFDEFGSGHIQHFFPKGTLYKDGKVFSDYTHNPTNYVGELKEYDKDGKLKVIFNYENGKLNGEALYYDNKEKLTVKKIYKDGNLEKIIKVK